VCEEQFVISTQSTTPEIKSDKIGHLHVPKDTPIFNPFTTVTAVGSR